VGKLLRLRDYILISAAFSGELFDEVRLVGGFLPSAMQNRYGFIPSRYKKTSYLTEVSDMLSVGDIERKVDEHGRAYLILTSSGNKKLKRKFRLHYKNQKWDGYFMIAVFDIPEKQRKARDLLRTKLIELGFGMMQKSVWINPYHFEEDLREFLELHGLGDSVFVLSAKKILAGKIMPLVEKIWDLKKINKNYEKVVNKIKVASRAKNYKRKKLITSAIQIYVETLSTDPHLPKDLLPKHWSRENALRLINKTL